MVTNLEPDILDSEVNRDLGSITTNKAAKLVKVILQYFGHLVPRTDSLEKTLMLKKTEGRRRG